MESTRRSKLNFPGTTDRVNQLSFISVNDGGANTFIGLNSGTKAPPTHNTFLGFKTGETTTTATRNVLCGAFAGQNAERIQDSVAIGYRAGKAAADSYYNVLIGSGAGEGLKRSQYNTAVGHRSMGELVSGSKNTSVGAFSAQSARSLANSVCVGFACGENLRGSENSALGAYAGANANIIDNVVLSGFMAGSNMRNVSNTVVIGSTAGGYVEDSDFNTIVGYATGNVVHTSHFNTLIGAQAAANVSATYTTMVGYDSMNRRNHERVNFSNCVVIGEKVGFDVAIEPVTVSHDDILTLVSSGNSFYDPLRVFPKPFIEYVDALTIGTGRALWSLEESRSSQALARTQREVSIFSCLEITDGTYATSWYTQIDNDYVAYDTLHTCTVTISGTSVVVSLVTEGVTQCTKTLTIPSSEETIWMDLLIQHRPEPQGIQVSWAFICNGTSCVVNEEAVVGGTDSVHGFISYVYAVEDYPALSYIDIQATTPSTACRKAAYTTITYNSFSDSGVENVTKNTVSLHTVRGNGTEGQVNATELGTPYLLLVSSPSWYGFTAAEYDIDVQTLSVDIGCSFKLPLVEGQCGIEWLASTPTTDVIIGDGYLVTCGVNGDDEATLNLYSKGDLIFSSTPSQLYTSYTASAYGKGAPLALAEARLYDEAWVTLRIRHNLGAPLEGIQITATIAGYSQGCFFQRLPALSSASYTYIVQDVSLPVDTSSGRTGISFFGKATSGTLLATDCEIRTTRYRGTPTFENSIFIGSNFNVGRDVTDSFLLNLGPAHQLINGNANVFSIYSDETRVDGSLVIGGSATSNYMAFRGLQGDGYDVRVPTTYMGERIYDEGTEKSEFLLYKGDDLTTPLGPDRIRLVSAELRYDVLTNGVGIDSFIKAGGAPSETIFVANTQGLTIMKDVTISGNITIPELTSLASDIADLEANAMSQQTLIDGKQPLLSAAVDVTTGNVDITGSLSVRGDDTQVSTTYMGERIYAEGTDKSEFLLYKGDDLTTPLGPDRIRLVSAELRYDVLTNGVGIDSFIKAGGAPSETIFVANTQGLTIMKDVTISGNITIPELTSLASDIADLEANAMSQQTLIDGKQPLLSDAVDVTTGNVDITGTLTVQSTQPIVMGNSYGFFSLDANNVNVGLAAPGTLQVGISAPNGSIQAAQFVAVSDQRVKKDIAPVDIGALASRIRNLRVTRWKYKDTVKRGDAERMGFVAQDVQEVLEEAVIEGAGEFLPDIYQLARRVAPKVYEFKHPVHALKEGTALKIVTHSGEKTVTVGPMASSTLVTLLGVEEEDSVFVYGTWAESVKNLDFDALTAAAIGAIQHLERRVDQLEQTSRIKM